MKIETFKDVWMPPFRVWGSYIFAKGEVMALTSADYCSEEELKKICSLLNGEDVPKFSKVEIVDPTTIKVNEKYFLIRGWGHLIGTGALHLDEDFAAKLQDDFVKWIIETIS